MSQKSRDSSERLKEEICLFYLNHKIECDTYYNYAESKKIGEIYEDVTDDIVIFNLFSRVGLVVLTANKYEKNILHYNIYQQQSSKIKRIEIELFPQKVSKEETYAYWFKWQDYVVLHIEAQRTGSYTMGGSADIVRYILNNKYLFPTTIISLGICFGTNEVKYSLGDVVISKKVYPYFIGSKISNKGYFVSDDNMFVVNSKLSAKIKSVIDQNALVELKSNVFFDNYITGEAVVSSKKARDEFVGITKQEIIAGEMEGYGLFKECNGSDFSFPCLIIKAICDWAVMKNFDSKNVFAKISTNNSDITTNEQNSLKDRLQAYAAFQAYSVLNILLIKGIFDNSIYEIIKDYVKKVHGRVILGNSIFSNVQQVTNKCIKSKNVYDEFANNIIKNLIEDKIIDYDEYDSGTSDKDADCNMRKYSFVKNREE